MTTKLLTTLALLAALSGCGGGDSTPANAPPAPAPAPAATPTTLGYTDPTSSGWRLVRDASSTSTRLVLGMGTLPLGMCVELEVILEVAD